MNDRAQRHDPLLAAPHPGQEQGSAEGAPHSPAARPRPGQLPRRPAWRDRPQGLDPAARHPSACSAPLVLLAPPPSLCIFKPRYSILLRPIKWHTVPGSQWRVPPRFFKPSLCPNHRPAL